MNNQFESGAKVRLKSGGPDMTVKFYDDMAEVACQWFDNTDTLKENSFPEASLEKVEPLKFPRKGNDQSKLLNF